MGVISNSSEATWKGLGQGEEKRDMSHRGQHGMWTTESYWDHSTSSPLFALMSKIVCKETLAFIPLLSLRRRRLRQYCMGPKTPRKKSTTAEEHSQALQWTLREQGMVAHSYSLTPQLGKLRLWKNYKYLTKGHTLVSSKDSDFLAPTPVFTFASGKASPMATILETSP